MMIIKFEDFCNNVSCSTKHQSFIRNAADYFFCSAGAAGSPVSDRPAPADPREHPESIVGEISHQTQRPLTSGVQTVQCVTKTTLSHIGSDGCSVHRFGEIFAELSSCPQTPLTAAAEVPFTYTFFVSYPSDMYSCVH